MNAIQFRCNACSEGQITFREWGIMTDNEDDTIEDGVLGFILGCTTCLAEYLVKPQTDEILTMVEQ